MLTIASSSTIRLPQHSIRHLTREQLRTAKAEAKRLPAGWYQPQVWRNLDEAAHALFLRQVDGPSVGNFLLSGAAGGFEVEFFEGGAEATSVETLGVFTNLSEAVDAITTLIQTTIAAWGLRFVS